MSKDLNKWMGIGRMGRDPEIKYMPNGNAVCNISIACGDDYKDKSTSQKVEKTEWVNVVAFGRLAEVIGEYTRKGSKIFVEGKFTTRKWQDQSGADRYSTEIVASEMQMLDSKNDGGGQSMQSMPRAAPPVQNSNQGMQQHPNAMATPPNPACNYGSPAHEMDDFDDEIPF